MITAVQLAESVGRALRYRLSELHNRPVFLHGYWASLDQPFRRWLADLQPAPHALEAWTAELKRCAWRCFYLQSAEARSLASRSLAEKRFAGTMIAALTLKEEEKAGVSSD